MQALVKAPRMLENGMPVEFTITGNAPAFYIDLTRRLFKVEETKSTDDSEGRTNIRDWDWFKEEESKTTPGEVLRSLRTMRGIRQAALAKKIGVQPQQISDMEKDRTPIGKKMAKKIGEALNINWKHFL